MPRPTLELSMIVRNSSATLKRCLQSVCHLVDRILIGDTGSHDDTIDIAHTFGAEVISIPWQNDFAHARNSVLKRSLCDWILILDSDDMLDPTAAPGLAAAIAQSHISAFDVCIWNYVRDTNTRFGSQGTIANPFLLEASRPYPAYARSVNTRLFRRHPEVFFERPVHETVSHRLDTLKLPRAIAPFLIHHFGHAEDPLETRQRKNELYQSIGRSSLQSTAPDPNPNAPPNNPPSATTQHPADTRPHDARTYFELGLGELEHYRRPKAALALFTHAHTLNPTDAEPLLFAGICLLRLRRYPEALLSLSQSKSLNPDSIVLHEAIGDVRFKQAQYVAARAAYSYALGLGSGSALIEAKLGASEVHLGQKERGMNRILQALRREPDFPELYTVASASALLAGDLPLAAEIATRRIDLDQPIAFDYALAASLNLSAGNRDRGKTLLQEGLLLFPSDLELQRAALGKHP